MIYGSHYSKFSEKFGRGRYIINQTAWGSLDNGADELRWGEIDENATQLHESTQWYDYCNARACTLYR